MIIGTTRFGQVKIDKEHAIHFPEGLLGFNDLRSFVFLDDPSDDIFVWLQSCESPDVAFPVLEPELFLNRFQLHLTKTDLESLKLVDIKNVQVFCIITIPDDATLMTANVKAPIIINKKDKIAKQCVLQENSLQIREPIFNKLRQLVIQSPSLSIKSQSKGKDLGINIRLQDNISKETEL